MRKILWPVVEPGLAEGRSVTLILQRSSVWRKRPLAWAPAGPAEADRSAGKPRRPGPARRERPLGPPRRRGRTGPAGLGFPALFSLADHTGFWRWGRSDSGHDGCVRLSAWRPGGNGKSGPAVQRRVTHTPPQLQEVHGNLSRQ